MAAPPDESAEASGFAACTLEADPRSIGAARSAVRSTLLGWDLQELSDCVESVVSELVANALRHGTPGPAPQPVMLSLLRRGSEVVCAVFDPGTGVPSLREPDDMAESGRGLHIVDSLSDAWGWSTPGPLGKAVWTRFSTARGAGRRAADDPGADWQAFARCLAMLEALTANRATGVRAAAA